MLDKKSTEHEVYAFTRLLKKETASDKRTLSVKA
jgi:hypothetical protein